MRGSGLLASRHVFIDVRMVAKNSTSRGLVGSMLGKASYAGITVGSER